MHFNVLIKTTHLETFRSVCSSDSDPPGDMLQACFAELPAAPAPGPWGWLPRIVRGRGDGRMPSGQWRRQVRPTAGPTAPFPTKAVTEPAWRGRGHPGTSGPT